MSGVRVEMSEARQRLILDAPRGNALTDVMVGELVAGIAACGPRVKLITLESAGTDFCFGAALDEHVPARMPAVLPRFHGLIRALLAAPAPTAAVVQGRCFGGGFELALACDVIHAAETTVFGLPEIKVGAFPPVGSVLLPLKVGAARAARVALTGDPVPVVEWHAAGLVASITPAEELGAAVERWFAWTLARHSAAALRRAALATRLTTIRVVNEVLPLAERLYLDDLLQTADAAEGVAAFLEKRPPRWTDA